MKFAEALRSLENPSDSFIFSATFLEHMCSRFFILGCLFVAAPIYQVGSKLLFHEEKMILDARRGL
jgi:hypothetical protein